jgi:hypothetical protein
MVIVRMPLAQSHNLERSSFNSSIHKLLARRGRSLYVSRSRVTSLIL